MIRFSAIINLWGEGNRTSRSDDFMYFKESTVRKPLLSSSPARRSGSSPLEWQLSKLLRLEIFISRKKDNKPRLNSILLHCNNEATKVFCTYIWCFYKIFIWKKKKKVTMHTYKIYFLFSKKGKPLSSLFIGCNFPRAQRQFHHSSHW